MVPSLCRFVNIMSRRVITVQTGSTSPCRPPSRCYLSLLKPFLNHHLESPYLVIHNLRLSPQNPSRLVSVTNFCPSRVMQAVSRYPSLIQTAPPTMPPSRPRSVFTPISVWSYSEDPRTSRESSLLVVSPWVPKSNHKIFLGRPWSHLHLTSHHSDLRPYFTFSGQTRVVGSTLGAPEAIQTTILQSPYDIRLS